ncbi:MAG: hypothetical protein H7Z14_11320, partial [Anaerolineae bacterium]|nr:hypothetical protein [Phycisphaerae bacterium]
MHVASQLGAREIPERIRETYTAIADIIKPLRNCNRFTFLGANHFRQLARLGSGMEAEFFWRQIHQLLILASRTQADSTFRLLNMISWALGNENEIALAMSTRGLVEHACAFDHLQLQLNGQEEHFQRDVWPRYRSNAQPSLSAKDRSIHRELLRFVSGRWTEPLNDVPTESDDPHTWNQFYAALVTQTQAISDDDAPRALKELINRQKNIAGRQHFRAVYNRLSEFCHPTTASRALLNGLVEDAYEKKHSTRREWDFTPALVEVVALALQVIPQSCDVLVAGQRRIAGCRMSFDPIEFEDRQIAPLGTVVAVDQHGQHFYARVADI